MKRTPWMLIALLLAGMFATIPAAAAADAPAAVTADELRPDFPQPYIVKKGDTLWDIANHFFKDPWKWLKIWERNTELITNPDLIYPGNKIWFDGSRLSTGGLTTVRPKPAIISGPVQRLEAPDDNSMLLTALQRQDFIQPGAEQGVGYLLAGMDERINYGPHDSVYIKLAEPAAPGDTFDIFRTTDVMKDPATGKPVGVLVEHLGQVQIDALQGDTYRGTVVKVFREISRGDRLKPARSINSKVVPTAAPADIAARIMYIRDDAKEAGQNQVCGISLGKQAGLQSGMVMAIFQPGRVVKDRVSGEMVRLPNEKVGEMIVLVPQDNASLAMITNATGPVHVGDMVLGQELDR